MKKIFVLFVMALISTAALLATNSRTATAVPVKEEKASSVKEDGGLHPSFYVYSEGEWKRI